MILGVALEMLGKGGDPLCEVGHLDVGTACVLLMQPECCDFCCLSCRHIFLEGRNVAFPRNPCKEFRVNKTSWKSENLFLSFGECFLAGLPSL